MAKRAAVAVPAPVPDMQIEQWAIERVTPYARNARKLSALAVDKVAASLQEFGWQQPLVVDREGVLIVGHTRLLAAKKLGMATVPVHVALSLTPAQVKAYRLMDNRVHQETDWDFELLQPEVLDLKALGCDLKLTGFVADELSTVFACEGWEPSAKIKQQGKQMTTGLEYRVVLDCADEMQQTELLDRFREEGLKCRALIS